MRVEDVKKAYARLGAEEKRGSDHIRYYLGKRQVGMLSHSWRGTLNDYQVGRLAQDLGLTPKQFRAFIDGSLSVEEVTDLWNLRRPSARPTVSPLAPKKSGKPRRNPAPPKVAWDARGRFVSTKDDGTAEAVRSAVSFFKRAVKRSDIRGILEDLSKL